ncbi:unannotated protein [freshwater metagenome]|uniref:Unannotated protein n=1 Tax=freshwater metagenome TaxID=449393 RepID=A0A6J7LI40_9ZZZZ
MRVLVNEALAPGVDEEGAAVGERGVQASAMAGHDQAVAEE